MTSLATKLNDSGTPVIIAEIGQNHDGSLGMAHAYIDAVADAGADAVKFQTHIAMAESTHDDQFRVKFSYQDATRFDYWARMEFTEEQWAGLKAHAEAREISFLSTPFSAQAVALLERIGVEAWKIGSGDVTSEEILQPILATGKPIIISSGMSPREEMDAVHKRLSDANAQFCMMHCTSKYPTPLTDVGLNNLGEMQARYPCRIGLSDHSGSITPSLAAIARGFSLVELHVTFHMGMFGPDVPASVTLDALKVLTGFARDLTIMDAHPVDKDAMAETLSAQKVLFKRSLALHRDLPAGHVLQEGDLTCKKPGTGLGWSERGRVLGRALSRDVEATRLLRLDDIVP
jgi:N,N'-diacetyllegionaminate synthase